MNPVTYTFTTQSYLSLLASVEQKFSEYKKVLLEKGIPLSHESSKKAATQADLMFINHTYKKEVEVFGTAFNFYNCLLLINYHLVSLYFVKDIKTVLSVTLTIEDYLIMNSFVGL